MYALRQASTDKEVRDAWYGICNSTARIAGAAIEGVGARAAAVIGLRILGMAAGGWITVGTLTIQVAIWMLTPDALEKWADHTAFGKKRKSGGYLTAKEQEQGLANALQEMGSQ